MKRTLGTLAIAGLVGLAALLVVQPGKKPQLSDKFRVTQYPNGSTVCSHFPVHSIQKDGIHYSAFPDKTIFDDNGDGIVDSIVLHSNSYSPNVILNGFNSYLDMGISSKANSSAVYHRTNASDLKIFQESDKNLQSILKKISKIKPDESYPEMRAWGQVYFAY